MPRKKLYEIISFHYSPLIYLYFYLDVTTDISTVLRDSEFITNFLIQQESDKLKVLEQVQQKNAKPYMKANGHPI